MFNSMHIELAWFGGLFRRTKAEWKSRFLGCTFSQGLKRFVCRAAYSLQLTCWLGRNSLCGVVANFGSSCYCFYRSICRHHWHYLSTWLHNSNFAPPWARMQKQVWGCPFDKMYSRIRCWYLLNWLLQVWPRRDNVRIGLLWLPIDFTH